MLEVDYSGPEEHWIICRMETLKTSIAQVSDTGCLTDSGISFPWSF